jgi:outer membrane protein
MPLAGSLTVCAVHFPGEGESNGMAVNRPGWVMPMAPYLIRRVCMRVVAVLLWSVLMLPGLSSAATHPQRNHALSLRESIAIALDRNLTIRLAERDVQTAESGRDQAFAGFLPKLSGLLDYVHKSEAPTLDLVPNSVNIPGLPPAISNALDNARISLGDQDVSTLKVTLQQPVFTGLGVTNNYRRSNRLLEVSRSRLRTTQQALAFEVVRAYIAVLRAQKAAELSAQQVRALEAQAAQARAFYEGGVIPRNDLLKAEVELANARQILIRTHNQVELARAHFNYALGEDLNTPLQLEELQEVQPAVVELKSAIQTAWDQRPELQELAQSIEAARRGVSAAQSQFLPQLSLVGTYTVDIAGGNPSFSPERWEIGGVLQWRAFEGGRVRAQVSEAKISQQKALDTLQQQRDRVALEVKEAVLILLEAEQKIRVAEKAIAQAEEHFRISQERYGAQIATTTEVVDAEALLTQARTNYFNAIYDAHLASFALQKATGVILE